MSTDLSNWRDPAHNVWGFQNANKIVSTASVERGRSVSALEHDARKFDDFQVVGLDEKPTDLDSFLAMTETDGIVVLKNSKIAFEHYDRTNTSASRHALFSISKSVTGLLCGILVEKGKLALDASVSQYVPEIEGSAFEDLTVRQLLDMRAGLDYEEGDPDYRKATGLVPLQPNEQATNLHSYIPTIKAARSRPVKGLDGPPFKYLSVNADLIGWVVERAAGETFATCLQRLVWEPMGAESDSFMMTDIAGNARTAAGLCATVRDVARLGNLVLAPERQGIVPESWIKDTIENGSHDAYAAGAEEREFEGVFESAAYRNYWVADRDSGTMMASGTNGQILLVDRKEGVVMAKTSSQPDRTNWDKIRLTLRAFREFERILR